jgi:predicted phosphodiesterase
MVNLKSANQYRGGLRVAALYDIHANIAALEAVLAEIAGEQPDLILIGGDVAAGPFPGATLDRLMALSASAGGLPVRFVRGNADREVVAAFDQGSPFDPGEQNPARRFGTWAAQRITPAQRDFLAGFAEGVELELARLGRALFCHASPRSDEEIITVLTPEAHLRQVLAGVEPGLVVSGHTHMQFDRVAAGKRLVNPGSVGMPYEARPGAYWALLGPQVELRRTAYDYAGAAEQIAGSGYPDPQLASGERLLDPPKPEQVAPFFEQLAAERGERG